MPRPGQFLGHLPGRIPRRFELPSEDGELFLAGFERRQFLLRAFGEHQDLLHRCPVFSPQPIDVGKAILDAFQLPRVEGQLVGVLPNLGGCLIQLRRRSFQQGHGFRQRFVYLRHVPKARDEPAQRADNRVVALVENQLAFLAGLVELFGIGEYPPSVLQRFFFPGLESRLLDLLYLDAQKRFLPSLVREPFLELAQPFPGAGECAEPFLHGSGLGFEARVRVQQRKMGLGAAQGVLFVLPVDVNEAAADVGQKGQRAQTAVEVDPVASATADDPLQHQFVLGLAPGRLQSVTSGRRQIGEQGLHRRLVGSFADEVGGNPSSQEKAQRGEHDGLPGAGLSGKDVEPGSELQLDVIDHGNVVDPELLQHGCNPLCDGPGYLDTGGFETRLVWCLK